MHITITGNLGSGKSTICKILEDKYGFEIYSTGKVQREIARELNITTLEMNQLMCCDRKYDTMIDDATARISRENRDENIIFDSRLAWHFVEQSFKVFLSVSLDVAAERVFNDNRGKEEQYASLQETIEKLDARAQTENKRYKDIYNLDYFDFSNYNLVIDSTYCAPEIIVSIIMDEAKKHESALIDSSKEVKNQEKNLILLSPKRLCKEEITDKAIDNLLDKTKEYKKIKDYINSTIPVIKRGNDYKLIEGKDEVVAALLAEVPFVPVVLTIS